MTYHQIIRQVALRGNMLTGPVASSLATTYDTVPLTQALFKSANFTFTSMKDFLRVTENEIALAVSNNENHVWRAILSDQTAALASGATIPSVGASGVAIIGVPSGVSDATNGKRLTNDFTLDEIRAMNDNPNGWRKIDPYQFAFDYPQIYHTRTNVKIDVCVWDADDASADIDANETLLFPEAEGAYVSGLGSKIGNLDPQFASLAAGFVPEYTAWLTALSEGKTKL